MRLLPFLVPTALLLSPAAASFAADADPSNYTSILASLKPGETLNLAPGTYTNGLNINNLNGSEAAGIIIAGPANGPAAVFEGNACCNTVEIKNSSYVTVRSITIDGKGIPGVFGVSAKDGLNNTVHHVTIEDCTFTGQGGSQQTVAISTKTPTFGWVIRRNVIDGAGTGLYLGNSNYADPFVGGLIENNLVKHTIGYNMQIKNQNPWPDHPALPKADANTIIRDNVFIKNDQPSPDGVRPNLFVGAFPGAGTGSGGMVEVYGNLFVHNVPEALMQATGRVSIHDNIFVDAGDMALNLRDHDGFPLKIAHVYNNTIYSAKRGVLFGNPAAENSSVAGNLIFADAGIEGMAGMMADNLIDMVANAAMYVASPSTQFGQMDFYPLEGKAEGNPIDLSAFSGESDYACDFNGMSKQNKTFRGAYAGAGMNPGWALAPGTKPFRGECGASAGSGGGGQGGASSGSGGGPSGGGGAASSSSGGDSGDEGGCGCRSAGGASPAHAFWMLLSVGLGLRFRRARRSS